jgi:hypothetical protein
MDNHSGWLIHHEQVGILVQNLQRYILRTSTSRRTGSFFFNAENIPRLYFVAVPHGGTAECHPPALDKRLKLGTGDFREVPDEHHVESLMAIFLGSGDFMDG